MDLADVNVRVMATEEWPAATDVSVDAFGGDEHIRELLHLLRDSWAWDDDLSFVAEHSGQVIGQVLFTNAFVDASPRLVDVVVLSPVGVLTEHQGCGVGTKLITDALAVVADRNAPLVFLEGNPTFYARFGFQQADRLGFTAPSVRIPPRAFQVRRFDSFEPWMTGALVYPDAFWRADAVGLRP